MKSPFLPREHGAWAAMLLPSLTALLAGRPAPAATAYLLAGSALLLFLAQEPLRVALGHRGRRALAEHGPQARHLGRALASTALATGALGLLLAAPSVRWLSLLPAGLGLLLAWTLLRGRERSLLGTQLALLVAVAASVPVARASGLALREVALHGVTWALGFGLASLAVQSVRRRSPRLAVWTRALALLTLGGAIVLWRRGGLATMELVSAGLLPAVALVVALLGLRPQRLRHLGWALAAAAALTSLGLLVASPP